VGQKIMPAQLLISNSPLFALAGALRHQAEKKLEEAEQMLAPASRLAGVSKSLAEQVASGLRRNAAELRRNADAIQHHREPLVVVEDRKSLAEYDL
jgi:hypothetical protein